MLIKGKGKRGRPPGIGEYVGLAKAKTEAAESILLEADARFVADVTSKLASAAGILKEEDSIERAPLREIGASITESLESIVMVSKKSKGLKATMTSRLKIAVGIIRSGFDELQRRICVQERYMREAGPSGAAEMASGRAEAAEAEVRDLRRRLEAVEAETYSLKRELEEERARRIDAEKHRGSRPSPALRMES